MQKHHPTLGSGLLDRPASFHGPGCALLGLTGPDQAPAPFIFFCLRLITYRICIKSNENRKNANQILWDSM